MYLGHFSCLLSLVIKYMWYVKQFYIHYLFTHNVTLIFSDSNSSFQPGYLNIDEETLGNKKEVDV